MQESKIQILSWKNWKATKALLEQTKSELMDDRKAIHYSLELP